MHILNQFHHLCTKEKNALNILRIMYIFQFLHKVFCSQNKTLRLKQSKKELNIKAAKKIIKHKNKFELLQQLYKIKWM